MASKYTISKSTNSGPRANQTVFFVLEDGFPIARCPYEKDAKRIVAALELAEVADVPDGLYIRMLTTHGPRNIKPTMVITDEAIRQAPDFERKYSDTFARAYGKGWTWSQIQKVWMENGT